MDLVPEDGTGRSDANTLVDLEFADDYFSGHPFYGDAWAALLPETRKKVLSAGSFALSSAYVWRGVILRSEQIFAWPRVGVVDLEGRIIASDSVPLRVKQAVCETAFHLSRGDPFVSSSTESLESLKIDVIELKFSGSTSVRAVPPASHNLLRGLGEYVFGRRSGKVLVG